MKQKRELGGRENGACVYVCALLRECVRACALNGMSANGLCVLIGVYCVSVSTNYSHLQFRLTF